MDFILDYYNYWACILIMLIGLYGVMAKSNLVKKILALGIFQTGILVFYISIGKVEGGTGPVRAAGENVVYSNPLPHALMLTAIVVGVATMAVGLAIVINIRQTYGTADELDIEAIEHERGD
ncbi:MAG: cation:proton antiporter subunit C [Planctomycetes bacterium]|nr:cation:proton antiporter subunit C [Planctomycetota bacterium]MCW8136446.1 cation:proton antiporter subunit C [Planctomycetota bacterium]